jgi:putative sterol carrier protein
VSEAAVTPKEFLEEMVARIAAKAEAFAGINWVLGYDFSASGDGEWAIVIEDGEVTGPFEGENSEATITTIGPFPLFVEESKKKFNPMTAMWNTGALRFHGDAMVAHRFAKMLAA